MEVPGVTEAGAGSILCSERILLERWQRHGDAAAREQLMQTLLSVVHAAARRYQASGEPLEDLTQVASIGALKAIDRFDLHRSTSLRAYAERWVEGELRHHMRDSSSLLHLPRALHARGRLAARVSAQLTARRGRRPALEEIAGELDLTPAEVAEALAVLAAARTRSLDELAARAGEERLAYADRLGADDPRLELVERRSVVGRVWSTLEPRARACVQLRLAEEHTYSEIAARLEISPTHAARLVQRSLLRLRAVALADGN
jgi:RNA polymerase sigma-B factor